MLPTKIETIHVAEFWNILFVRLHTDAGYVGLGETYYTPRSTRAAMELCNNAPLTCCFQVPEAGLVK